MALYVRCAVQKLLTHSLVCEICCIFNAFAGQVLRDGSYVKKAGAEKLSYGPMVFIRAMIAWDQAARGLAQATTIAVRYSCVRRQSELKPGYGSHIVCCIVNIVTHLYGSCRLSSLSE